MGLILLAIALGIISELFWFLFYRNGKKNFTKYDKEHSKVAVSNVEEIISKLNQKQNLGISNIVSEVNQISFIGKKSNYTINIENGMAYVDYDTSGCEVRVSLISKLIKRFNFWKSANKAMFINIIMDMLANDGSANTKEYEKTKFIGKSAVIAFASFLIFLVIGCFSFAGSVSNEAVSDAQKMEFRAEVTYEELVDSYIKDAEWTAFNGEGDIAVVEVTGTSVEGEDVCIQFWGDMGMGLSYKSLTLKFCEIDGVSLEPDVVMEYVYMYYYANE